MRLTNTFSGRPAFYDRNPLQIVKAFALANGPLAVTQKWAYTVPSARKAHVSACNNELKRAIVATTAGFPNGRITITPSGGSLTSFLETMNEGTNALNDTDRGSCPGPELFAGDLIQADIADSSTGGSNDYRLQMQATEYDA